MTQDDSPRQTIIRRAVLDNSTLWTQVRGCQVRHGTFGAGTIVMVVTQGGLQGSFTVRFDQVTDGKSERRFQLQALFEPRLFPERRGFPALLEQVFKLAYEAIEAEAQRLAHEAFLAERRRQDQATRQAAVLEEERRKRKAADEVITGLISKARQGGSLNEAEIALLRERGEHGLIASHFEREYERRRNPWDLIRASSEWRSDDKPRAALKATERIMPELAKLPSKIQSALLTTRGATFRDLGNLDAAESCTREAIGCDSTNPYPYNLLGAIYIQRGETSKGEEYLAMAERHGAKVPEQRRMIEQALRSLNVAERARMTQALLQLNPERYAGIMV